MQHSDSRYLFQMRASMFEVVDDRPGLLGRSIQHTKEREREKCSAKRLAKGKDICHRRERERERDREQQDDDDDAD